MSGDNNQQQEIPPTHHPEEEEELILLQETATMDSSTFFDDPTTITTTNRFSNLHITNHPPCANCGCNGGTAASSSSSHKRPSSEPVTLQPNPKKPNHNANSLFGFSKINLPTINNSLPTTAPASASSPLTSPSRPVLRRSISDPCDPPTTQVVAEPPQSPPHQNANMACSGTPSSAAKLPPRPPTLRRSVSDPTPSPVKTISSSCDTGAVYECPNERWARRMGHCLREMTRKWDELLSSEDDSCREGTNQNNINNVENNDTTTTDTPEEGYVEAVVEKVGECLVLRFKCPCERSYQILLSGKNCYYRVS